MAAKVTVLYFAKIREYVGCSEEAIELAEDTKTVGELASQLEQRHAALSGRLGGVRFAVNEAFSELDEPVGDGDTIAVIPPVSGG